MNNKLKTFLKSVAIAAAMVGGYLAIVVTVFVCIDYYNHRQFVAEMEAATFRYELVK